MSESKTTNPEKGSSETPGNQTGENKNLPSKPGGCRKVILGCFLFFIPIFIIFWIYVFWPTIPKDGADVSQKEKSAQSQQLQMQKETNTTDTPQTGNPDDSSSKEEATESKEGGRQEEKKEETSKKNVEWAETTNIFGWDISVQLRMIILVFLCGALGSYIHMATSFTYHIGFNSFDMDWFWWYWLRMPIGGVLALIFSLLIQGGVFTASVSISESQPVTLLGLAALVGLFSRQANEKLKEVFDVIFKSKEGEENITRKKADGDKGQGSTQQQESAAPVNKK